ncbi:MAG: hypothetical protein JRE40_02435 [Deltaproteobacteria bacterium]|nr:hypothetical protein [Deltaproteobacteria bacterium]
MKRAEVGLIGHTPAELSNEPAEDVKPDPFAETAEAFSLVIEPDAVEDTSILSEEPAPEEPAPAFPEPDKEMSSSSIEFVEESTGTAATPEQVNRLSELCTLTITDPIQVAEYGKVQSFQEMQKEQIENFISILEKRAVEQGKGNRL